MLEHYTLHVGVVCASVMCVCNPPTEAVDNDLPQMEELSSHEWLCARFEYFLHTFHDPVPSGSLSKAFFFFPGLSNASPSSEVPGKQSMGATMLCRDKMLQEMTRLQTVIAPAGEGGAFRPV